MSGSLAPATPLMGMAFAADIRELLMERPINRKKLQVRVNDRRDGRRVLLAEYSGHIAPEALLALAAAEVAINPNTNRVDHAAKLRYLATTCSVTGRPRHGVTPGLELEWIELTMEAVGDVLTQLTHKEYCGPGRKQCVGEYEKLLTDLRQLVEQRQAA